MPQGDPMGYQFMAGPTGQRMQRNQQRDNYQGKIDDLMRQLQFGQLQGMNPMQMADLQMQMRGAQRDMGNWQNQQYGQQMAQMTQPGAGSVGGSPGHSQMQRNPYLEMLLMGQLGMGGGIGGGRGGQQIG